MKKNRDQPLKILVANGVNLDLLGHREPEHYGKSSLTSIAESLTEFSAKHPFAQSRKIDLSFFQSNVESEYLEQVSLGWDGAILNPGAWTHTSLALADRLAALKLPFVEVHLSNLAKREELRRQSYCASLAVGVVFGFGGASYHSALVGLFMFLQESKYEEAR